MDGTANTYEYLTLEIIMMTVWMSTKMIGIPIKMKNTQIRYFIMKWADVIKLFWNKYVQKITCQTKERIECAW